MRLSWATCKKMPAVHGGFPNHQVPSGGSGLVGLIVDVSSVGKSGIQNSPRNSSHPQICQHVHCSVEFGFQCFFSEGGL